MKTFLTSALLFFGYSVSFTQTVWNGHTYTVIPLPLGASWHDAKADAESRGGYLATIGSSEENALLRTLIDNPAYWVSQGGAWNFGPWFGLFHVDGQVPHRTGWAWANGEPSTFANSNTAH